MNFFKNDFLSGEGTDTDDSSLDGKRNSDGSGNSSDTSSKRRPARTKSKNPTPRKRSKKTDEPGKRYLRCMCYFNLHGFISANVDNKNSFDLMQLIMFFVISYCCH